MVTLEREQHPVVVRTASQQMVGLHASTSGRPSHLGPQAGWEYHAVSRCPQCCAVWLRAGLQSPCRL